MECLAREGLSRVTPDCDGSVSGTGRHAEGTAAGFNGKRKGARSCQPLLRTIARIDRVPDVHHRPGNVHDSNGADTFISHCMSQVRSCLPHAEIETRVDSTFLNETIVQQPHSSEAEFTASVPFERFSVLKSLIEGKKRWCRPADGTDHFETRWKSWNAGHRLIPVGKRIKRQHEQPIQPDLFRPVEYGCEFKVTVTDKRTDPSDVVAFHEGRGSQEGILAEPGTHRQMDCMPVGTRVGNQPYMFAGIPAREPRIQIDRRARGTTPKRAPLRCFREMETLRRTPVRRTGRIIRPGGKPILPMNGDDGLEGELRHALTALNAAA